MWVLETLPGRITKTEVREGGHEVYQITLSGPYEGAVLDDVPKGSIWEIDEAKGTIEITERYIRRECPKVWDLICKIYEEEHRE